MSSAQLPTPSTVSIPTLIIGLVAAVQFSILLLLITPMPIKWRKSLVKMLLESPLFAKLIYGLKIASAFVAVLLLDAGNTFYKLSVRSEEYRSDSLDGGDMGTPANADRSARLLLAERNLAFTATTLALAFVLYRVFELNIQVISLGERLALKEGKQIGESIADSKAAFKNLQDAQKPDFNAKAAEGNALKRKNVAVQDSTIESTPGNKKAQ